MSTFGPVIPSDSMEGASVWGAPTSSLEVEVEGDAVTQLMLSESYHTQGVLVSITPLWKSPLLPVLSIPRDSILAAPLSRNDKGGCKEN